MIGKAISHYRVTAKLGAGGRIQCVAVSSHADREGFYGGPHKQELYRVKLGWIWE